MRHEARTTAILALPGLRAALARLEVEPDEVLALVLGDERCRYPVLRELVSGPNLDADRMDYLLRDAYFTGVEGGGYDFEQLVASLRIFEHGGRPALGVDWRGVHALEGFVLARYFMFSTVYFHHTTRQFERVLHEALRELWPQPRALDPIEEFLAWDDFRAFEGFRTLATPAARAIRERKPTHALVAEFNAARDLVAFERVRTALATRFGESLWIDQQEQLLHRLPLGAEGEAPTVLVRNFGGLVDAREASDLIARLAGKAYWRKIFVGRTGNDCAEARRIARAAVRAAGSGDERSGGVRGAVVTGT